MHNHYESPQVQNLGEAHDVIVDQKQPSPYTESLGVPFSSEPDELDDFDE